MLIAGEALKRAIIRYLSMLLFCSAGFCHAQSPQPPAAATSEKIVIDTDIGDDIDDAFAVALALRSPELQILGISTTFGDTETRAKLLDRLLGEVGRSDIPVAVGTPTTNINFTQRRYAEGGHFASGSVKRFFPNPTRERGQTFHPRSRVGLLWVGLLTRSVSEGEAKTLAHASGWCDRAHRTQQFSDAL